MKRTKEQMDDLMIAVYVDETFLAIGTEQECSDITGISIAALRRARTPKHWREYEHRKLEGTADTMTVVIVVDELD